MLGEHDQGRAGDGQDEREDGDDAQHGTAAHGPALDRRETKAANLTSAGQVRQWQAGPVSTSRLCPAPADRPVCNAPSTSQGSPGRLTQFGRTSTRNSASPT